MNRPTWLAKRASATRAMVATMRVLKLSPSSSLAFKRAMTLSLALLSAACATAVDNGGDAGGSSGDAATGADRTSTLDSSGLPDGGSTTVGLGGDATVGGSDAGPEVHDAHGDQGASEDAQAFDGNGDDANLTEDAGVGLDATAHESGAFDAGAGSATDAAKSDAAVSDSAALEAGSCTVTHLLLSQIQSRGAGGATDEFVELYNPTGIAVALDPTWTLTARSATASSTSTQRWKGVAGAQIPAHGHFLIAGAGYGGTPSADANLSSGITDASGVVLMHSGAAVDAICYAFNATTQGFFDATYDCPGTPVSNLPHDNTSSVASDVAASLERKPGGSDGNCIDTASSASDFHLAQPSDPHASTSAPTP
jgi:hypothetical protein